MKHICLYCSSPCEVTLATSSEGCTNPKCKAHTTPRAEKGSHIIFAVDPKGSGRWETADAPSVVAYDIETHPVRPIGVHTGRLRSDQPNLSIMEVGARVHAEVEAERAVHRLYGVGFTIDKRYLRLLQAGQDIHSIVAAQLFGVDPEQVTLKQRKAAKSVLLAERYGHRGKKFWEGLIEQGLLTSEDIRDIAQRMLTVEPPASPEEFKTTLSLGEVLRHRWLGTRARVVRVPRGEGKDRVQYLLDPDEFVMGRVEGTQGELLREWQRDARLNTSCADVSTLKKNTLWWPNTMRVTYKETAAKKDQRLLGVLSLVSVLHKDYGRVATYDYITVELPHSGRCRIKMTMREGKDSTKRRTGHLVAETLSMVQVSENFSVSLTYADQEDIVNVCNIHLPRLLKEFEAHRLRGRRPRKATMAEMVLFQRLQERGEP